MIFFHSVKAVFHTHSHRRFIISRVSFSSSSTTTKQTKIPKNRELYIEGAECKETQQMQKKQPKRRKSQDKIQIRTTYIEARERAEYSMSVGFWYCRLETPPVVYQNRRGLVINHCDVNQTHTDTLHTTRRGTRGTRRVSHSRTAQHSIQHDWLLYTATGRRFSTKI